MHSNKSSKLTAARDDMENLRWEYDEKKFPYKMKHTRKFKDVHPVRKREMW